MNVVLLDDEFLALRLLETYLGQLEPAGEWRLTGAFQQPLQALEFLSRAPVDVLFLDVQMPRLSGTELLRALPVGVARPVVVFTTAYDAYAVEAFGLDAVDYLPKPFGFPRFVQAANKVRAAVLARRTSAAPATGEGPETTDFLTVRADGQYHRLPFAQLLFVEGWQEYVRLHTTTQGVLTVYARLKNIEAQLPAGHFLRVHKSYIVSTARVEALDGNELRLGAHRIPISRAYREQVLATVFRVG